jgi:hypothetical protein
VAGEGIGRELGQFIRKKLADLLADTPELAVLIDTFEQPIERPRDRAGANTFYSGKQKRHTLKVQVAVDEEAGRFVDVSTSFPGPTSDVSALQSSGVLGRLPTGLGALGDLATWGWIRWVPGSGRRPRDASPAASPGPRRTSLTTGSFRGVV